MGSDYSEGLATDAFWSNASPRTVNQNGTWQVGARIFQEINSDTVELPLDKIIIYPNPASSTLHIRNVEEISTLELVNLLGQVTYRQLNSGNASIEMSLDGQSSGVYMIRFTDADKNISIKKLIIE